MASQGFPVATNTLSFEQLLLEGRARWQVYSNHNWTVAPPTVVAGAAIPSGGGFFTRPGKKFIMTSLTLNCDGPARVEFILNMDTNGGWFPYLGFAAAQNIFGTNRFYATFGASGGSVTIPIPAGYVTYENTSFTCNYLSNNTTGRIVSWTATGLELPNEPNMNAKIKIAVFGDSTSIGNNLGRDPQGRAYLGNSQWSEVIRDRARADGHDVQIFANLGEDGRRMEDGYYGNMIGVHKVKYDIGFVSYGMNNAPSAAFTASSEAKFKEAATSFILERNKYNSGSKLVFLSPNATDDPDRLTGNRIGIIRQWIKDVATDATIGGAINNVFYFDQALAMPLNPDKVSDLNFKDIERIEPAIRVHPSGLGSTLLGNGIYDTLKNNLFP